MIVRSYYSDYVIMKQETILVLYIPSNVACRLITSYGLHSSLWSNDSISIHWHISSYSFTSVINPEGGWWVRRTLWCVIVLITTINSFRGGRQWTLHCYYFYFIMIIIIMRELYHLVYLFRCWSPQSFHRI
jgi:hypothetical protein